MAQRRITIAVLGALLFFAESSAGAADNQASNEHSNEQSNDQMTSKESNEEMQSHETQPTEGVNDIQLEPVHLYSVPDLCEKLGCKEGKECIVEEGKAICQCIQSCSQESSARNMVCTTGNVTFNSECEFRRQICLCNEQSELCVDENVLSMHLDYYGACVSIKSCSKEELTNFPTRMAEWLKSVMEALDLRQELSVHYSDLHRRSRRSSNPLVVPAIWEFCNMDSSQDRILSRSEFFPLIAPLKALEHCIGDFLDKADQNSNGEITLSEWGAALNIGEDEIEDICEKFPETV